ncbi:MAG: hypothetical protein PUA58_04615, partial [Ruminococcus sp.]|nr:hypothetical protein [Ruminococcus sp.]
NRQSLFSPPAPFSLSGCVFAGRKRIDYKIRAADSQIFRACAKNFRDFFTLRKVVRFPKGIPVNV